jgi:hypothetical protein
MKIKFDPTNPLSEAELDKLGKEDFDAFLEYLDQKSAYLLKDSKKVASMKKKSHEILKQSGVKNVKTHRSQWFD